MIKKALPILSIVLAGSMLVSCSPKQDGSQNDKSQETQETNLAEEAVNAPIPGVNGTKYNADFFNNPDNLGEAPSADKYLTTPSGLKYVIVEEGSGKTPGPTDKVTVHYVGEFLTGMQFDSSIDRGEPTTFGVNQVIPGWTEGLQLMKEGGVAVFYIPSEIGYGAQGAGYNPYDGTYAIPPHTPLLFWVQLLEVK